MSKALYKFLQKAVLEGKPGAEDMKRRYTNKARLAIIDGLARVEGKGGGSSSPLLSLPISEVNGGDVLKKALAEAREGNGPWMQSDGEARDLLLEWLRKRPGK